MVYFWALTHLVAFSDFIYHILSGLINGPEIEAVELVHGCCLHLDSNDTRNPLMDAWFGPLVGVFLPILLNCFL